MNFLERFFDEKEIDRDAHFEIDAPNGTWHLMTYGVVIDTVLQTRGDERAKIEDILRQIDFKNGDVRHFLRYLGMGLAMNTEGTIV